ncbi:MAG: DUF1285 domain-containing protein [Alphaproteobacteria bacterium]
MKTGSANRGTADRSASDPGALATRLAPGRSSAGGRREPVDCGHFDIRIGRDGTWYYRGSPIGRKPLVTLFSSVLHCDESGQHWLVTPVERGRIDVDDAPFVAVAVAASGTGRDQVLIFTTNIDEAVTAGPEHPLRVETDPESGEPRPYLRVRDRLDALVSRPVFYELVGLGVDGEGADAHLFGVWSGGAFFALGPRPDAE